jgi:methionyl-tRNA formyltransferase
MQNKEIKIGFFGTPDYAVTTLKALKDSCFNISFVVTMPDRPQGRKMILTAPPAKIWAEQNNIPVIQPESLKTSEIENQLKSFDCDLFVVIAYGKIIPENILNIPKYKSLNIHGSLLPKLRGSCPIETAILKNNKVTGVSIIKMDKEMDHGPIIAMKEVIMEPWPPKAQELGNEIVKAGSELLVSVIPDWIAGKITPKEQDHNQATFTKKIEKDDGLIDLKDDPYQNYLKIQAYNGWPSAFFFINKNDKKIRVKITQASFKEGKLIIEKVIPEGKAETTYESLLD